MSARPLIKKYPVLVNGSMAGSLISSPSIIDNLTMMSYQASWVGSTPIGTISVQVSNDYALAQDGQTASNAGTWTTISFEYNGTVVTSVPVTGNTGNGFLDIASMGGYAVRLIYTRTSGTGTLNVIFNAKVA